MTPFSKSEAVMTTPMSDELSTQEIVERVLEREAKMLGAASPPETFQTLDELKEDQALDAPDLARHLRASNAERDDLRKKLREADEALIELSHAVTHKMPATVMQALRDAWTRTRSRQDERKENANGTR